MSELRLRGQETRNAIWCDECEEWECVWCHDFNSLDSADVDKHAIAHDTP
jgi:hypothetical protein